MLLETSEGPLEAMSQHRSLRGGGEVAGGCSQGSTFADVQPLVPVATLCRWDSITRR